MRYWVYENWTLIKARIHKATCSHCADGTGVRREDSGLHGKWHGPFGGLGTSTAHAHKLKRRDTRECAICL